MRQEPQKGAPVVHGSEPAEPTSKHVEAQLPVDPVSVFAPWAAGTERAMRLRMHRARDIAQARASRSKHPTARSIYWTAAQVASGWVFARAPQDDLSDILEALSRLFLVAGTLERLEAPDER